MMPSTGIEPARYCYHTDLNGARLPVPPRRLIMNHFIIHKLIIFCIALRIMQYEMGETNV